MEFPFDFHILGERAKATIFLTRDTFYGKEWVTLRKGYIKPSKSGYWSDRYISLTQEEAQELRSVLDVVLGNWNHGHSGESEGKSQRGEGGPSGEAKIPRRISLQDQVLIHLVDELDQNEVRVLLLGDGEKTKSRFTELGKALRRCGHLEPHGWKPTPLGQARAKALRGEEPTSVNAETTGVKVGIFPEILAFPGGQDLSDRL